MISTIDPMKHFLLNASWGKAGLPTLPPVPVTGAPHTAAEASGVAMNGAMDRYAFITATITNVIEMCVCVGIFMCLQQKSPQLYQNNLQ